jgi:hypothetical protein
MDGSAPAPSNALRCHEGFDWLLAEMKPLGIWTSNTIHTGIADKTLLGVLSMAPAQPDRRPIFRKRGLD